MCGIVGFVNMHCGVEQAEQRINAMCQAMRHRGPDDQGTWVESSAAGSVAIGMRRLAIIDLAGSQQPIFNEDQSMLIIFNGEIYNYQALQQTLKARGHQFRTHGDTETILHAYEEFGDDCVNHLHGMFTFAIWDRQRQRLFAARDRFGKKPFNYYWHNQQFIFASEIKSILEMGIPREIEAQALDEFLVYRYVPTPLTLFKHVMKLPAAHTLVYEQGQVRLHRYWDLPFVHNCYDDEATAIERATNLLEEAVRMRLMSEVPLLQYSQTNRKDEENRMSPLASSHIRYSTIENLNRSNDFAVGAFLSGGLDSSVVVGMMSRMMSQPVKTFSIGFEEETFNELPYARKVAQHCGTEHHEFIVKYDLISILPQLVWDYDEPFADSSLLPTYYVSKLAREHVTAVLTGDGGDEIFGGYEQYRREYQIYHMPALVRTVLAQAGRLLPRGVHGKQRLQTWRKDFGTRSIEAQMLLPDITRSAIYSDAFMQQVAQYNPQARYLEICNAVKDWEPTARMQYVDTMTYLPDDILVKVDKASMFNSLETRAPLLDHRLAEYVASLHPGLRVDNGHFNEGHGKYLLKKIASGLLPPEILERPKCGFAIPIDRWFRNDMSNYAHDILSSTPARKRDIFAPAFMQRLLSTNGSSTLLNHSQVLWSLLCLELWFQIYIDTPGRSLVPDKHATIPSIDSIHR